MKVLIIHCSYKFRGGEDTVVSEEIRLLESRGIDVEFLAFSNQGNELFKLLLLPFNFFSYWKVIKKIREVQPDVVHIHNLHFAASPAVPYAIKKCGIPFVTTLHNYRLLCPSGILFHQGKPFLHSLKQRFPWQAIWKGVYKDSRLLTLWVSMSMQLHQWLGTWKLCDRYIVLSDHGKKIFLESKLRFSQDKLVVKPNFSSVPKLIKAKHPGYFLFVGRLSEEKGISLLLRAFARVGYNVKIAGDGPLLDEVIRYSERQENIEYLGVLNKDDIFVLLNNCTALVFPSTWFEGMPLTIIEAFACGAPVIASNLGAMEVMIRDQYNGLHFKAGDENDLVEKLQSWCNMSDENKDSLRENARSTYAGLYTPEKNADQLVNIYQGLLGDKPMEKAAVA